MSKSSNVHNWSIPLILAVFIRCLRLDWGPTASSSSVPSASPLYFTSSLLFLRQRTKPLWKSTGSCAGTTRWVFWKTKSSLRISTLPQVSRQRRTQASAVRCHDPAQCLAWLRCFSGSVQQENKYVNSWFHFVLYSDLLQTSHSRSF